MAPEPGRRRCATVSRERARSWMLGRADAATRVHHVITGAALSSHAAFAQRGGKRPVIGFLTTASPAQIARSPLVHAFLDGMRGVGWTEGRDFEMAYPTPSCEAERCTADDLTSAAHELVRLGPSVI